MIEWKRMSCAVDFSEPSRIAMESAIDLARRFQAELSLVHVVVPPPPAASDVLVSSTGMAGISAQEGRDTLERWRAEAEERVGGTVRASLLSGDASTEIVKHARELDCDLVVIGTHGRSGIRRFLLGSVAESVVRRAKRPVLVVGERREPERRVDLAGEAPQERRPPPGDP